VQAACTHALKYAPHVLLVMDALAYRVMLSAFAAEHGRWRKTVPLDYADSLRTEDDVQRDEERAAYLRDALLTLLEQDVSREGKSLLNVLIKPPRVLWEVDARTTRGVLKKLLGLKNNGDLLTCMEEIRAKLAAHVHDEVERKEATDVLCIVKGGIGAYSIKLRARTEITQGDLAKHVGCSFATISRWERHPDQIMRTKKTTVQKFMTFYRKKMGEEATRLRIGSGSMDDMLSAM